MSGFWLFVGIEKDEETYDAAEDLAAEKRSIEESAEKWAREQEEMTLGE